MDASDIPPITREEYDGLPPIHQGWFARAQSSNPKIPHCCHYRRQSPQSMQWWRGWMEATEDLSDAIEFKSA